MDPKAIASALCDEADELLAGVTRRIEAKAAIAETVNIRHGRLPAADKKAVIDLVMRILDNEGFFEAAAGGPGEEAGDYSEASEA